MAFAQLTDFQASLLPASYDGVFFFVIDAGIKSGQRVAQHEYPFRDTPYNEPLGKATRQFTFTGFLVGDAPDLQTQYAALLNVIELPGPGTLVHPVFGQLQVIPVAVEFEQHPAGRYVEVRFQFVEAGQIIYPSLGSDTQADTIQIAAQAQQTNVAGFAQQTSATSTTSLPGADALNPTSQTPIQDSTNRTGDAVLQSGDNFGLV